MGKQTFVLKPHETRTVFPVGTYAVGTHEFAVTAEATAILCSLMAKVVPVGATVQVKNYYYVTGDGQGSGERVERQATAVITNATAPLTSSVIVTQFHHTIKIELIVTGSPVECAVMVTPGFYTEGSGGGPSSDVNILGQPIQVTVENGTPIDVAVVGAVDVNLLTPNPVPVTGTVSVSEPVDVVVTTPVIIDDSTPISVAVSGSVTVVDPVDVVVTTPVVIDDSTPVQVQVQEPIDVTVLENIRQQMLKDTALNRVFTWLDFGTKNQRLSTIVFTSSNLPLNTVTRTFSYTLVGTRYRLDTDVWTVT